MYPTLSFDRFSLVVLCLFHNWATYCVKDHLDLKINDGIRNYYFNATTNCICTYQSEVESELPLFLLNPNPGNPGLPHTTQSWSSK